MKTLNRQAVPVLLILLLSTTGCATLTTAAHFTADTPMVYSGARLDLHAKAGDEEVLRDYREKYGVVPPAHPSIDLPFSLFLDTVILVPFVLPFMLYQAVFD